MTFDQLLEAFPLLAEAPNGVAKLRELILQLAVQGKLVSQDPDDEPASVLQEKIQAEKERLFAEGKIRKQRPLTRVDEDETPYQLPPSWLWTRLGEIAGYGTTKKVQPNQIPARSWVLELEDIEKNTSKILQRKTVEERKSKSTKASFRVGDVLYGKLRPYLNKVIVADEDGFCTTEIVPLRIYTGLDSHFIMISLGTPVFHEYVNALMYGVKMPRLGTDDGRSALFALPPLAEQKRIVAKVAELMALCDELEARQQERNATRASLNGACLHALTSPKEPGDVPAAAKRIFDNFEILYDNHENVKELRKAILQLAVQGKLVPQDPKDEPASVLLNKIKAEKDGLMAEGKIKKPKPLPMIEPDEVPFELPEGWEWARFIDLFQFIDYRGKTPLKSSSGIRLITAKNIRMGYLKEEPEEFVTLETYNKWMTRGFPEIGDLLFTTEAPMGNVCMVDIEELFALAQRAINLHPFSKKLLSRYFMYCIMSPTLQEMIGGKSSGMTATGIKASRLKLIPLPVPPVDEQKRIEVKIDALMGLCDDLETALVKTKGDAERLMDAVVHEMGSMA